DWTERELTLAIICSILPVMLGTVAVWYSVRNLWSALRGDNVPVIRPLVSAEELDRLDKQANRWLMVAWAGGLIFVFVAGIDGSSQRVGLLGALIFVGSAGYFLVAMVLVPLSLLARPIAKLPDIRRLQAWLVQPKVALVVWVSGAVAAGIYAFFGLWHRVAHR